MKKYLIHVGIFLVIAAIFFGCSAPPFPPEPPQKPTEPTMTTTTVKAYFSNVSLDPKTESVALAAMTELLDGPTDAEKTQGYTTNINPGVKVQKLTIENLVAKVDFDKQLERQVGGSCRVTAIMAQITQTLKQFPTVKNVVIFIDGRTENILQP